MAPREPTDTGAAVSEDRLLGGRVRLRQPIAGPRAAIDAVFLAAAVPAEAAQHVLDVGTGHGAAGLCLARRVDGLRLTGLELRPEAAALARENAALNGLGERFRVLDGDVARPPPALREGRFDHVMSNPPHLDSGRARAPGNRAKALAHVEDAGEDGAPIAAWVDFCVRMTAGRGTVTILYRADRLDALLDAFGRCGLAGGIVLYPLWPRADRPAKRIVAHARKGRRTALRLDPGLVLHEPDGAYSAAADAVLRHAAALVL